MSRGVIVALALTLISLELSDAHGSLESLPPPTLDPKVIEK